MLITKNHIGIIRVHTQKYFEYRKNQNSKLYSSRSLNETTGSINDLTKKRYNSGPNLAFYRQYPRMNYNIIRYLRNTLRFLNRHVICLRK